MFLNAVMLVGLAGAAVPVVLHLLSRARYREVSWGAMMFLGGLDARQQYLSRARQCILLLVRMGLVAAVAMALARPVMQSGWDGASRGGRVTAVLVLDCSAAMGFEENGRSRLDMAREAALQILARLRQGDQVALALLGETEPSATAAGTQPTSDLQAVASRLNDLRPMYGEVDIAEGLRRALDILDRHEPHNRELYVICDRRAESWRSVPEQFIRTWREHPTAGERPTPLWFAVCPVGSGEMENLAVESIELADAPAIRGRSVEVEVRLRNYGAWPRTNVPLELRAGGQELGKAEVHVAAGASVMRRFPVTFQQAGSQVLRASVRGTGMTWDDQIERAIDVVDPIRVLIVSGDERPEAFGGDADFAALALAPYRTAGIQDSVDGAAVTMVAAQEWGQPELKPYQVVILANVPQLSAGQVRALEQFVYEGGGLLVAGGNLLRIESYNDGVYRDGVGVLPAALHTATAADGSAATTLLGLDLGHPIFGFLRGRADPVPVVAVRRYLPATPRASEARVLGSYASGQPFLIESAAGRGRVLLLTTSLDADWTALPLSGFYLPFVQSMVRYLASGTLADRNLRPGQPLVAKTADLDGAARATLTLPDGSKVDLSPTASGSEFRYGRTLQPGRYVLEGGAASASPAGNSDARKVLHFVVSPAPGNSDLTPLTDKQWEDLGAALSFERIDGDGRALASVVGAARAGRELWNVLLGAALALGVLEVALMRLWAKEGT